MWKFKWPNVSDILTTMVHSMRLLDTDLPFMKTLANNVEYAGFERYLK